MIALVEAKPGQGKSVYAIYRMIHVLMLRKDVQVRTNIPIKFPPRFDKKYGDRLGYVATWQDIKREMMTQTSDVMSKKREGTMIFILDELSLLLDANNWDNLPQEVKFLLRQHRKYGVDILGFSQSVRDIDVKYRRLVQRLFTVSKVFVWPYFFAFGVFYLREWDSDDVDLEKRERQPLSLLRYPPELVVVSPSIFAVADSWHVFEPLKTPVRVVQHVEVVCDLHGANCTQKHVLHV